MVETTAFETHGSWYSLVMRHILPCGGFKLIFDMDQEVLWVATGDGKKKETFEVKGPLELFGFGSGDFAEGPNARDIQSDLTGRWLAYNIKSSEELCILEADRRLPEHIRKMDLFGKATETHLVHCFFLSLRNALQN